MKTPKSIIYCVVSLWLTGTAFATGFKAKVTYIADGDTITFMNDTNEQIKICLNGIDFPEKNQVFGKKVKQLTKDLVGGQTVTVQAQGKKSMDGPLAM